MIYLPLMRPQDIFGLPNYQTYGKERKSLCRKWSKGAPDWYAIISNPRSWLSSILLEKDSLTPVGQRIWSVQDDTVATNDESRKKFDAYIFTKNRMLTSCGSAVGKGIFICKNFMARRRSGCKDCCCHWSPVDRLQTSVIYTARWRRVIEWLGQVRWRQWVNFILSNRCRFWRLSKRFEEWVNVSTRGTR